MSCLKRGQPVHSSMYKNLRTNLPKEVMAFPDFPFATCPESFVHHTKVLDYLESYARHLQLGQYVRFNTKVKKKLNTKNIFNKNWL